MTTKTLVLFSFITLFLSFASHARSPHNIIGTVINEQKGPLDDVSITIENASAITNNKGHFLIKAPTAETYQLIFSKAGYYPSIQTFSHFELSNHASLLNSKLTEVILVKKNKNRVMLAFGGDVMMARRYYKPHFNATPIINEQTKLADSKGVIQHIKPYMSIADYASVNLETQISKSMPKQKAPKSIVFYSQPEILDALSWAGVDYVTLGNNHTYDYMNEGLSSSLDFLQKSKLDFSGAGFDEPQALKAHHQKISNSEFSMLGYVGWEGRVIPTQTANSEHGGAAFGSMKNILESVNKETAQNKITIAQYHGSLEYENNPTMVTEQRLKSALDAGASLAIAHHPHVTQGIELYNNKLIAYSMGNLVFDQYFPSTPLSFILYVWLDQGKFHRAEIVPLYLKAFRPSPATGINRDKVMKRLSVLSKQRNTHINQSGGHGVIVENDTSKTTDFQSVKVSFDKNEKVTQLPLFLWHKQLSKIDLSPQKNTDSTPKAVNYRLGTNLINGSDFESFNYFENSEQSWLFDEKIMSLNHYGASGYKSLALTLKGQQKTMFGMKYFARVYARSNPMTIKAKIKTSSLIKIRFYWQGRKKGQKLFTALQESKKHLIKEVTLTPNKSSWKSIEVDFNSPRYGYKSYRVIAEIETINGKKSQVDIDDFSLIEWQTAFSRLASPQLPNLKSKQAQFIGLDKEITNSIELQYQ